MDGIKLRLLRRRVAARQIHSSIERTPVFTRVSVKRDYVAQTFGQSLIGEKCTGSDCKCQYLVDNIFPETTVASIGCLIRMLVNGYSNIPETPKELESICRTQVLTKLHKYKTCKGAFTTYVWSIVRNALNRKYNKDSKYHSRFVEQNEFFSDCPAPNTGVNFLKGDLKESFKELIKRNSGSKGLIEALVGGNPFEDDFELSDKWNMAEAARKVGLKDTKVRRFVNEVVKPFLKERFQMKENQND